MNPDVRLSRRAMDVVDGQVWGLNEHGKGRVERHMESQVESYRHDFV
jgi:hypothetical protein